MFKSIIKKLRSWYPLSQVPPGYFGGKYPSEYDYRTQSPRLQANYGPESALTLSPFFAGLRLFQTTLASLPLMTYQRGADGSRMPHDDKQVSNLLNIRPNKAQSRATFFEYLIRDYFLFGNAYVFIQWAGNHRPVGLYPIPAKTVVKVELDDEWGKTYTVQTADGQEVYADDEVIHCFHYSHCGIKGTPFIHFAGESLQLHHQVLDSATAYYANSTRPSGYLKFPGKMTREDLDNTKTNFKDEYTGTYNTGRIPLLQNNGEFVNYPSTAAADAQIVEALGASVADVARWIGLSPLMLGDLSRGTYSNLASDNLSFYQKSLRPLLDKFELEINAKVHGVGSDVYSTFEVDEILRADPLQQAQVWQTYITSGIIAPGEVRTWLDLPPKEGTSEPLQPLNMTPASEINGGADGQDNAPLPNDPNASYG